VLSLTRAGVPDHVRQRHRFSQLDGGRLGIAVLDAPAGPRPGAGYAWTAASLDIQASGPLHAGVDGEAVTLPAAVHFESRPGALRVRIAHRHAAASTRRM
jgi:hypothetical protein